MLYFKEAAYSLTSVAQTEQLSAVLRFRDRFKKEAIYFPFETTEEFATLLRRHLTSVIRRHVLPRLKPRDVDQIEVVLAGVQSATLASGVDTASPYPHYLVHDNVLWADDGAQHTETGGARATGPLCPNDRATLRLREGQRQTTESGDRAYANVGTGFGVLVCLECQCQFLLTADGSVKRIGASRSEVEARFDGLRRQR
jgi:hypothetical protein